VQCAIVISNKLLCRQNGSTNTLQWRNANLSLGRSRRLRIKSLSTRYAPDLPDVLRDISFDIEPGMRVGLVGSTGSGKSTLALSLFRAIEARQGEILIDSIS
jgi:ABC-type bacteriocin/lantibiotic exporter with double-glycine peptidase domain